MKHKDIHDLVGGTLVAAVGLFAVMYAEQYELGELRRMGPGFFPTVIGYVLMVLGVLTLVPALFRQGPAIRVNGKGLLWVIAAMVVFAAALVHLGLLLSTLLAVLAATVPVAMAWRTRLMVAASVAFLTYVIFIVGLGMVMPVWPVFLQP